VPSDDVDDSKVIEDVYVPSKIISVVEDMLVDSSTPILNEVHVSSEDTSDFEYVLVESSIHVHVARYSLARPMIEDEIEYETVATSVVTSSK